MTLTDSQEIRIAALNAAVYRAAHGDLQVDESVVMTAEVFENYIREGYRSANFL